MRKPLAAMCCILALGAGHALAQQAHAIDMTGLKFVPDTLQVKVGDTVTFVNKDLVPHTATQKPSGWDSGTIAKEKSWTFQVDTAGAFDFICRFHPVMKGKLIVE